MRRFQPPWRKDRIPGGWEVKDATGFVLLRVYGDDRPKGVSDMSLTLDEARRIAAGVVRLPELLGGERAATPAATQALPAADPPQRA